MSHFKVIAKDGRARAGVLKTKHGEVKTPVFMPVGTQGTVKALTPDDLKKCGAQIILGNTYHLYLRPGSKLIKKMGGLHKFMGWDGPILTDSGGFQAFSLGSMITHGVRKVGPQRKPGPILRRHTGDEGSSLKVRKGQKIYSENNKKIYRRITVETKPKSPIVEEIIEERVYFSKIKENGVEFISHLDGSKHLLSPQKSIEVQLDLGSDIILTLDELLSPLDPPSYVAQSLERTHRWEIQSKEYFEKNRVKSREKNGTNQLLFGILQGVYDKSIRQKEAQWISRMGFDGFSIGGSFGTSKFWGKEGSITTNWAASKAIYETFEWVTPLLPDSFPRHALGIGEIQDFFECIERGIDMFDCVAPTRRARNGSLYISPKNGGKIANKFSLGIQRAEYKDDKKPVDPGCGCLACQNFSRSYLRHLYTSGEILYHNLATIHNVYFALNLVGGIREAIIDKKFAKLKQTWLK